MSTVNRLPAWMLIFACLSGTMSSAKAAMDDRVDALSPALRDWLEKEVVYIISDREREGFLDLQSNEERAAFIDAFWRLRDPDKLTPENEFKVAHYERIEYANHRLGGESSVPGWMTDRGRIYITLGEPAERETFDSVNTMYPTELWFYHQDKQKSLPPLYLLFFQEFHAGPYRLFNHALDEPADLMPANSRVLDARSEVYQYLMDISPQLAHATINMRADQGVYANFAEPMRNALDTTQLLADIQIAPFRRLNTRYVNAGENARGLVETDYMFNYVPSSGVAHVLPGPGGAYFVHYSIEIEPQHMTLAKDEERYYTTFELRGEVTTTEDDVLVHSFTREPYVKLSESQFREVGARPFAYRSMFPLREGDYQLRVVLKNRARSEYTIFDQPVLVPTPDSGTGAQLAKPILLYGYGGLPDNADNRAAYRTYREGRFTLEPNARHTYVVGSQLLAYISHRKTPSDAKIEATIVPVAEAGGVNDQTSQTSLPRGSLDPRVEPSVVLIPLAVDSIGAGRYKLEISVVAAGGELLAQTETAFDVSPRSSLATPWALRDSIEGENLGLVKSELAHQFLRTDEPARARGLAAEALEENPNTVPARLLLARFALDDQDYQAAIRLLEPARAQAQDNADILQALGDAHFQVNGFARAKEVYERALALRGPTTALLNGLAVCAAQTGDTKAALAYLDQSLALDDSQQAVHKLKLELEQPVSPPK